MTLAPDSVPPIAPALAPELERSRYPLPSVDARTAGAGFVTRAIFDGTVVCATPPRSRVEALLPPELRLVRPDGIPPSADGAHRHPLLFVFGRQRRCAMRLGGIDVERDIAYHELVLVVPFVTHRRVRQLAVYVPAMASSYYLANWTGSVHYGFGKRPARVHAHPPLYAVTLPEHGLAFRALAGVAGPWRKAHDARIAPALRGLTSIASLPWWGRRSGGELVRSWSDWRFAHARVRETRARCSVHAPLAEGLAPGEYAAFGDAAFEIRDMQWWLTWPRPCPS